MSKMSPLNKTQLEITQSETSQSIKNSSPKKSSSFYFTIETEDAIAEYNDASNFVNKQRIYDEKIKYPFSKIAENLINRYSFPYFNVASENLKDDVISHMLLNIHKYKKGKGKAFSYFSVMVKNYLIGGNNEHYRFLTHHYDLDNDESTFDIIDESQEKKRNYEIDEFVLLMKKYWENNMSIVFKNKKELKVVNAVLQLFDSCENIENFNKKALYLIIREITDLKTQYITTVVNKMKEHNKKMLLLYNVNGVFDTDVSSSIFI